MKKLCLKTLVIVALYTSITLLLTLYKLGVHYRGDKVLPSILQQESIAIAAEILLVFFLKYYVLAASFCLIVAVGIFQFFKNSVHFTKPKLPESAGIAGVLSFILTAHLINNFIFPLSQWALNINYLLALVIACIAGSILLSTIIIGFKRCLNSYTKPILNHKSLLISVSILGLIATHLLLDHTNEQESNGRQLNQHLNIVIVGIDSLRLDQLKAYGGPGWVTPNLNKAIPSGTLFKNTYTPLARTFPSWVTILSGKMPDEHGARVNLYDLNVTSITDDLLTTHLKSKNYRTIYATDERRFSNIDESYGFDMIIGPKIGVGDFIAGSINDFPINNLASMSPLGNLIFPYNRHNRANHVVYDPGHFANKLARTVLKQSGRPEPLFLASHLCLAHWPYLWRSSQQSNLIGPNILSSYQAALHETDKQIGEILSAIEKSARPTLLILLSDHGEALGLEADAPHSRIKQTKALEPLHGHGTNVASLSQYRVLLSFIGMNGYKIPEQQTIDQLASLADIKPTIIGLIESKNRREKKQSEAHNKSIKSSIDLTSWIDDRRSPIVSRSLLLETGFLTPELATADPDAKEVLKSGIKHYEINKKGRLVLKRESAEKIIRTKSFSRITNNIMTNATRTSDGYRIRIIDIDKNLTIKEWNQESLYPITESNQL